LSLLGLVFLPRQSSIVVPELKQGANQKSFLKKKSGTERKKEGKKGKKKRRGGGHIWERGFAVGKVPKAIN